MSPHLDDSGGVRLAIEGCGHGTLHAIYASIAEACVRKGWPCVDLLIIGGDFQAVRNAYDLNCVSMPAKYRSMCDFHEYYSGQRKAPYLTIFVGGNHEASNYLFELYYGGWVAPNIYYMGAANVLRLGPLRIAGMSGIWKGYNYRKPHHERLPYNESDIRSIYHVRDVDVRKLLQIRSQIDIGISHDWPNGVEWKGDWKQLFRYKRHLQEDAERGQLGSVAAKYVLDWLRPRWWFSAHLHCKYAAVIDHNQIREAEQAVSHNHAGVAATKNADEIDLEDNSGGEDKTSADVASRNAEEIELDIDDDSLETTVVSQPSDTFPSNPNEIDLDGEIDPPSAISKKPDQNSHNDTKPEPSLEAARAALPDSFRRQPPPAPIQRPPEISNTVTNFLALDKCLPGNHFLQLMEIPSRPDVDMTRPFELEYDREWLAITRTFALEEPLALGDPDAAMTRAKEPTQYQEMVQKHMIWVGENLKATDFVIPENFEVTAPVYDNGDWNQPQYRQAREYPNPQTARFCKMLEIPNPFDITEDDINLRSATGPRRDPDAERFGGGRRGGGFGRGRGGGGRDRGRGRGRGGFRGR